MEPTIQGKLVTLRPSTPEDRRAVYEWANLSDVACWVNLPPNQPISYEEFCSDWRPHYFDGSAPRDGRMFIIEVVGQPVGMVAYNDIDAEGRVEVDVWLSRERHCGRGYGPDAITTLCGWLGRELGVREVWSQPSARNHRSVRAFEKCGFVRHPSTTAPYAPRDFDDGVTLVYRTGSPAGLDLSDSHGGERPAGG